MTQFFKTMKTLPIGGPAKAGIIAASLILPMAAFNFIEHSDCKSNTSSESEEANNNPLNLVIESLNLYDDHKMEVEKLRELNQSKLIEAREDAINSEKDADHLEVQALSAEKTLEAQSQSLEELKIKLGSATKKNDELKAEKMELQKTYDAEQATLDMNTKAYADMKGQISKTEENVLKNLRNQRQKLVEQYKSLTGITADSKYSWDPEKAKSSIAAEKKKAQQSKKGNKSKYFKKIIL